MNAELSRLVAQYMEQIIADRRRFHANPELSREEFETSQYIKTVLEREGIEYKQMTGTGIAALIRGKYPGKTIMIRGDMDALPIVEETNLPFASKNAGKMHACGHDIHTANLLGLVRILKHFKDTLHGNIKFCFQPAEEGAGGALVMIKDGVLENPSVDYAIGMHVDPSIAVGCAALEDGPITSYPQFFTITLKGRGGHGSAPFRSIDPIQPAVRIYEGLTAITKEINPLHFNVVHVCAINAGTAPAVIPDECILKGTVRTHYAEDKQHIEKRVREIVRANAELFHVRYEIDYRGESEPVVNDPAYTAKARESVKTIFDGGLVESVDFKMVGEDFSHYAAKVPASFIIVGCGTVPQGDPSYYPLHNGRFNPDERVLEYGAKALGQIALDYLA
ncbi:MAG: M20 metallopeptidase family protein [Treponema sp.]